ncbi:hypothetical protein HYDPIDRAFT_117930 [Hydnomerulius pinastri MD-312]|uniref:Uncharacterized protein n=1 Tax=Hydnomerulius pinastri MD-312 TaxID=994086 RepID=A0A0C9W9Y7_9AGAM|nr:hypothetical protein HYDPIDRAFT_117930 [Hydnomerulius pinastri MD-312]
MTLSTPSPNPEKSGHCAYERFTTLPNSTRFLVEKQAPMAREHFRVTTSDGEVFKLWAMPSARVQVAEWVEWSRTNQWLPNNFGQPTCFAGEQMVPSEPAVEPSPEDTAHIKAGVELTKVPEEQTPSLEMDLAGAKAIAKVAKRRKARQARVKEGIKAKGVEVNKVDSWFNEQCSEFVQNQQAIIAEHQVQLAKQDTKIAEHQDRMAKQDTIFAKFQARAEEQEVIIAELRADAKEQKDILMKLDDKVARLDDEVAAMRAELTDEIDPLIQVTAMMIPLPLWCLLHLGRIEVLNRLSYTTWEDLREGRVSQLPNYVFDQLASASDRPSLDTIKFLCCFNNVMKEGNHVSHSVTPEEIKNAITSEELDSCDREDLEEIYKWVFKEAISI